MACFSSLRCLIKNERKAFENQIIHYRRPPHSVINMFPHTAPSFGCGLATASLLGTFLLLLLLLPGSFSSIRGVHAYGGAAVASVTESPDRLQGYKDRGYRWPVREFVPNTPGWNKLMEDRLEQIASIEDPSERFKGYTTTLYSGLVIRNFTEHGFARTRISESLLGELQRGIRDGFDDRRNEGYTPSITGNQAWHIQRDDLTAKVEDELHDKLEEWGGTDLDLTYVYGLRLFRNTTTIRMHLDKKGSHSLGYVLHVGASDDYDPEKNPWPFLIEDFHGRTHEITMVPGDLILFEGTQRREHIIHTQHNTMPLRRHRRSVRTISGESHRSTVCSNNLLFVVSLFLSLLVHKQTQTRAAAKLVHGRPHQLNASWYCNVVGHYYPRDETWASMNHVREAEYAVPPHWAEDRPAGGVGETTTTTTTTTATDTRTTGDGAVQTIEFRGGLREPGCTDGWCRSTGPDLVRWKGPSGSDTHWIDADGVVHEFVGKDRRRRAGEL